VAVAVLVAWRVWERAKGSSGWGRRRCCSSRWCWP